MLVSYFLSTVWKTTSYCCFSLVVLLNHKEWNRMKVLYKHFYWNMLKFIVKLIICKKSKSLGNVIHGLHINCFWFNIQRSILCGRNQLQNTFLHHHLLTTINSKLSHDPHYWHRFANSVCHSLFGKLLIKNYHRYFTCNN